MSTAAYLLLTALALLILAAALFPAVAWARRGPHDTLSLALLRLTNELFLRIWHRLRWRPAPPATPVPLEGPALVVANHRSGLDPLAIIACNKRIIQYLMAREYYELPALSWLFRTVRAIPVKRDGSALGATKAAMKVLQEGGVVGIFPQGGIRLESDSRGDPIQAKAGAALLALRCRVPIIPVHIRGTPSCDAVFRSILTPSRSSILFGEPFQIEPAGKKPTREEIDQASQKIQDRINELWERPL